MRIHARSGSDSGPFFFGRFISESYKSVPHCKLVITGGFLNVITSIMYGRLVREGHRYMDSFTSDRPRYASLTNRLVCAGDSFSIASGDAQGAANASVGGLVPMIQASQKASDGGSPFARYALADMISAPRIGKTAVALRKDMNSLYVVIQEHTDGMEDGQLDFFDVRDKLALAGYTDAVFLDGSDSVLAYANHKFVLEPAWYKKLVNWCFLSFASLS